MVRNTATDQTADRVATEYQALRSGTAIRPITGAQPLRVQGEDRAPFLQRMTTNDVESLQPGQSNVNVLSSPTGHIVSVFTVVAMEDHLLLLPAVGQSESLSKHLRGQIFFMDKVEVQTVSWERIRVMGPLAQEKLSALAQVDLPEADNDVCLNDDIVIVKQERFDLPGYELAGPKDDIDAIIEQLTANVAVELQDDDAYETARIEMGRPSTSAELTEKYSPLETGLSWTYSQTKGCFTGQEILARQTNYDKITKALVGLTSDAPLAVGERISVDGKPVGEVTSATYSSSLNSHIALAIVRQPHYSAGSTVEVAQHPATVVDLPFATPVVD